MEDGVGSEGQMIDEDVNSGGLEAMAKDVMAENGMSDGIVEEQMNVQQIMNGSRAKDQEPYFKPKLATKQLAEIDTWDEHIIGIEELCARYGYRADYLMRVGVTT